MRGSPEIEAVFRRYWESAVAQDLDTFGNYVSREPGMRSIAVAEDEWWEGHDFVVGITAKRVEELGVVRVDYHRLEGYESGSTGWAAADLVFVTRDDSRFRRRFTATFLLEEGVWRMVQGHASQGVPNTQAWGFELTGSLEGLVDSLDEVSADEVVDAAVGGTVTVMFTDIEDSTRISMEKGDQAWLEMVENHFAVLRRITERGGGRMVKTLGDGAMMIFPSAGAGIDVAMEAQRTFSNSVLVVRVGLHTGDAMRMAGDYVGVTVAKAARVAAAASGGEILVSSVTAALATNPKLRYGDTREVELKGLPGLHPLVPVLWNETE